MARIGVDYESIKQAAVKLLSQGIAPSVQKIREVLGTGSNTTIAEHLKVWRDEYAKKTTHYLPANMPKELISTFEVLWQTAMDHAQNQLAEYKQAIENDRELTMQKERDAERSMLDIKQKMGDISALLEQTVADKQKLNIELAITNERLIKQDEIIIAIKNQHEDRLKRVYEEKDIVITQCNQLQNDIKSLQEKISSQAEQHQKSIAQQNASHEQSENRWAKLIDQGRGETKDTYKKLENLRNASDIEIKKLKMTISELQKNFHEKNAQLNVSIDQISQLKQDIKIMESEIIKARSIIMKLEEEQKSKNIIISQSEKINKKREKILQPEVEIVSK